MTEKDYALNVALGRRVLTFEARRVGNRLFALFHEPGPADLDAYERLASSLVGLGFKPSLASELSAWATGVRDPSPVLKPSKQEPDFGPSQVNLALLSNNQDGLSEILRVARSVSDGYMYPPKAQDILDRLPEGGVFYEVLLEVLARAAIFRGEYVTIRVFDYTTSPGHWALTEIPQLTKRVYLADLDQVLDELAVAEVPPEDMEGGYQLKIIS